MNQSYRQSVSTDLNTQTLYTDRGCLILSSARDEEYLDTMFRILLLRGHVFTPCGNQKQREKRRIADEGKGNPIHHERSEIYCREGEYSTTIPAATASQQQHE